MKRFIVFLCFALFSVGVFSIELNNEEPKPVYTRPAVYYKFDTKDGNAVEFFVIDKKRWSQVVCLNKDKKIIDVTQLADIATDNHGVKFGDSELVMATMSAKLERESNDSIAMTFNIECVENNGEAVIREYQYVNSARFYLELSGDIVIP